MALTARHQVLVGLVQQLFGVITDDMRGRRYNVRRGPWRRSEVDGRMVPDRFADEDGPWIRARDIRLDGRSVERKADHYVLAAHVRGDIDIAIEASTWCGYVVLDIDRPDVAYRPGEPVDAARELAADGARDRTLAMVWRAYEFGTGRLPVIWKTPGGGYHLYLPHSRPGGQTWPRRWAVRLHERHLDACGVERRAGVLEVYPTDTPLRAPCGRRMFLLDPTRPDDPDDLGLVPTCADARMVTRNGVRQIEQHRDVVRVVDEFLARMELARRPIEDWLWLPEPAWDERWGPWGKMPRGEAGDAALASRSVENPHESVAPPPKGGPGVSEGHGHLVFGAAWRAEVARLWSFGVRSGSRHDGVLKWAWYWFVCRRAGREGTLAEVESWLRDPSIPHESPTLKRHGIERFVRISIGEAARYVRRLEAYVGKESTPERTVDVSGLRTPQLRDPDRAVLRQVVSVEVHREATAILSYVSMHAAADGYVDGEVELGVAVLAAICGQRRIETDRGEKCRAAHVAVADLIAAGMISLAVDYSQGRHGRRYYVWYKFGSGELPACALLPAVRQRQDRVRHAQEARRRPFQGGGPIASRRRPAGVEA